MNTMRTVRRYVLQTKPATLPCKLSATTPNNRSEEHTSELQSRPHLVCRLLLEKKNKLTSPRISLTVVITYMPQQLVNGTLATYGVITGTNWLILKRRIT